MPEVGYPLDLAVADLRQAGQLQSLWYARDGVLVPLAEAQWEMVTGSFQGAGLDSRTLLADELFVALRGDHTDGRRFLPSVVARGQWALAGLEVDWAGGDDLSGVLAAEGAGVLVCRDGPAALGVLGACRRRRWKGTLIGITGSNGKTTTKDLCAAMLSGSGGVWATTGNHNNRLGVPLTLLGLRDDHAHAVIEMGASAIGQIAGLAAWARPDIGIITNAADAHLAEFGSLAGVIQGKGELVEALPAGGTAVLNTDSPGFSSWVARARCPVVSWGTDTGDHRWSWRPDPPRGWATIIDGSAWPTPLPGRHSGANLTAAWLAVQAAGIGEEAARAGLGHFQGSAHRSRLLNWDGRLLLDDSYNANPGSMISAGRTLVELTADGRSCAVLGAMAELGPETEDLHRQTGQKLADLGVTVLVAVGSGAESLGLGFDQAGGEAHYCADHEEAAGWLKAHTRPGDAVLLKGSRSAAMETILTFLPHGAPET